LRDDRKTRYDGEDVPELRENDRSSGKRPVLADALSGVQGKDSAGGDDHKGMPEMRPGLYLLFSRPAVAEILSGLPDRTQVTTVKFNG
jgi:hypothetical protein